MASRPTPPPIPPDRADGESSFIHRLLILSEVLSQISPLALLPAWLALLASAIWPWSVGNRLPALALIGLPLACDGASLALLPRTRRSWGPVTPSLLGLALVRTLLSWALAPFQSLLALGLVQGLLSAVAFYATWIEPFAIRVQRLRLEHPALTPPLRALHVSDVHFEHLSLREEKLLALVEQTRPDLLLFTGDYLNRSSLYEPAARAEAQAFLARLQAPLGVYAVTGSPVVDDPALVPTCFAALEHIRWLDDERVPLPGYPDVWLIGVRCTYDYERDVAVLRRLMADLSPSAASILLYHTPDLMPEAVRLGVTLYLAGHTHGGQIAVPLLGPVFASSCWGLKYARGLFREGTSTLYVSRGLGVEGLGAPRARFCAPPEVGLWELTDRVNHGMVNLD